MRTWDDLLDQPVSDEHASRVSIAVARELDLNRERAGLGRRWFTWRLVGGLGMLGLAALGIVNMVQNSLTTYRDFRRQADLAQGDLSELATVADNAGDFEVVSDLDVLEDLDALEAWNGENA